MFAGIPAGSRIMEVQHPLLDSLGLKLSTPPQIFRDGDSSLVMLSVPSARTYASSRCTPEQLATGPAVIVGTVTNADSDNPAAGATVTVAWLDYEIGKKFIKSIPQRRTTQVSPTGVCRVCGLPDDLIADVFASRGSDSTASVEVDLRTEIGTVALKIPSATTSFISGRVVDSQGKPAAVARVSIETDEAAVMTGVDGTFTLRGIRPGTRRLMVRKIGFEPLERSMNVPSDGLTDAVLSLGKSVAVLKAIVVKATRDFGLQRVGFTERKSKRPGVFFAPKDIESRNGPSIGDLLKPVPMMRRRGCTRYFVDGRLQQPTANPDEYLSGAEIGAVEVYSAGFSPPEFYSFTVSGGQCKSVVIWTKWKIDRRR